MNDNQISNFNFFIISKKQISSRNDNNLIKDNYNKKTKRGRKRKREDISNCDKKTHDKFSDDNMRKKCKNIVLKYILEFINRKKNILVKLVMGI